MYRFVAFAVIALIALSLAAPSTAFEKMTYRVVVNHEEQYSIVPQNWPVPDGWKATGKRGTLGECHDHIEEVWTDMRPLSVRDWDGRDDYQVIVNHEEQYVVWPAGKEKLPTGWKSSGKRGRLQECQAYIEEVWTDMRPLSVRKKLGAEK